MPARRSNKSKSFLGLGPTTLMLVLVVALVSGIAGWAIKSTLVGTNTAAADTSQSVWVAAEETTIGSALNLSTTVKQPVQVIASNHLTGVVSSIAPGEKNPGEVIYSVAGTEVYLVSGQTPFYQDIAPRASGDNVKQVEQFLKDLDFFSGTPNTSFDAQTTAAIKKWQASTKQKATGVIELGSVIAVNTLPGQVDVAEAIKPGKNLSGGEDAVLASSGDRSFTMTLTEEQAAMIPQDSVIEVNHGELNWMAQIQQSTTDESRNVSYTLASPEGGQVCREQCDQLPSGSMVTLRSKVIVVPETTGIGIPAAAVSTTATGQAQVTTEAGTTPVEVVASSQGIVIVTGLEAGTAVRVLEAAGEQP